MKLVAAPAALTKYLLREKVVTREKEYDKKVDVNFVHFGSNSLTRVGLAWMARSLPWKWRRSIRAWPARGSICVARLLLFLFLFLFLFSVRS